MRDKKKRDAAKIEAKNSFLLHMDLKNTDLHLFCLNVDPKNSEANYAWISFKNHELAQRALELAETKEGFKAEWVPDERQSVVALKKYLLEKDCIATAISFYLDDSQKTVVNFGEPPAPGLLNHRDTFLNHLDFALTDLHMVYLKVDFKDHKAKYAWVAFKDHELARKAWDRGEITGFKASWIPDDLQSVDALKRYFETNSMAHEKVRGDLRPCFYEDGQEVNFTPKSDLPAPKQQLLNQITGFIGRFFPFGPPEPVVVENTFDGPPEGVEIKVKNGSIDAQTAEEMETKKAAEKSYASW